jgi:hypothetical protein
MGVDEYATAVARLAEEDGDARLLLVIGQADRA